MKNWLNHSSLNWCTAGKSLSTLCSFPFYPVKVGASSVKKHPAELFLRAYLWADDLCVFDDWQRVYLERLIIHELDDYFTCWSLFLCVCCMKFTCVLQLHYSYTRLVLPCSFLSQILCVWIICCIGLYEYIFRKRLVPCWLVKSCN